MAEAIAFYTLSILILGLGVAVITTPRTVHSVVFLVLNFLCVAVLYVVLQAEFLAVIQILVYAVLYLFVVMLVNLKRQPEEHQDPRRLAKVGLGLTGAMLLELAAIVVYSYSREPSSVTAPSPAFPVQGNIEQLGWLLYTDYLIPFEVASVLLLVAMVGAIILARREL
jgi:NADH-quinone oxidoreductase subunit J